MRKYIIDLPKIENSFEDMVEFFMLCKKENIDLTPKEERWIIEDDQQR